MIFDVYYCNPRTGKPDVKPHPMEWDNIVGTVCSQDAVRQLIAAHRAGDKTAKAKLPSINFVGRCREGGSRKAADMTPTQLFMIDIDHCTDATGSWERLQHDMIEKRGSVWVMENVALVHLTPSRGLHIIMVTQGYATLEQNMKAIDDEFDLGQYGDFDVKVKDFSRVSFAFLPEEILYQNKMILSKAAIEVENPMVNASFSDAAPAQGSKATKTAAAASTVPEITDEMAAKYEKTEYRGFPVKAIIEKYVEVTGEPGENEIHNYYNELVKYFRNILGNDKKKLLYLLPRFGHTAEECWGQITSICRVNTLSELPKAFYFFLKDNGFIEGRVSPQGKAMKEYMLAEDKRADDEDPPFLPPVIRELAGTAPKDFKLSCINSLLPILGTLTSYAQARYPYDNRMHTTSFFSIIYAPPGTGKGFVERFMDMLFEDIKLRDQVQQAREDVYLRFVNRKSQNDKSPDLPHTSLRIIPPKNSEAEFLEKMCDNKGYHMFTFAAEMDSWAKGVKAAGGNKDDMIRIAWDNGLYGQQFKSTNTFKGSVELYWNVLITGTLQQVMNYFKNVENGLVTRCSFTSIENQEFAEPPVWKSLTTQQQRVVKKFCQRCDANTYETPCTIDPEMLLSVNDDDFDKEIDWHFKFKERQTMDCSWIMPVIKAFHKEQIERSAMDYDHARDVFRRRVAVRGFRLALLCMCLWEKPTKKNLEHCKAFIDWWMHRDLDEMLKLWGDKYNNQVSDVPNLPQKSLYAEMKETFTDTDLYVSCTKLGIKTPIRRIVHEWKKIGKVVKLDKGLYKKIKK